MRKNSLRMLALDLTNDDENPCDEALYVMVENTGRPKIFRYIGSFPEKDSLLILIRSNPGLKTVRIYFALDEIIGSTEKTSKPRQDFLVDLMKTFIGCPHLQHLVSKTKEKMDEYKNRNEILANFCYNLQYRRTIVPYVQLF